MKTSLKIYVAACSLMAALGSCSHEAVVENVSGGAEQQLRTITMQAGLGNDSRIAFQEDDKALHLLWEENDAFSVLAGTAVQMPSTFTLTEGAGTSQAKFQGEIACNDGDMLYAVWPKMNQAMVEDNQYYLSLEGQKGVLDDQYTFMVGKGQYKEGQNVRMSFSYATAALRMNISLPADVEKITKVEIKSDVYSGACISIDSGGLIFDGSTHGGITIENEFPVVDGQLQVVAYLFAWDYAYLNSASIIVTDENGEEYVGFLGDGNIRPGKLYDVNVNAFAMINFENEDMADGSEDKPYQIATTEQLYSWMLRCNLEKYDSYGNQYRHLHYQLISDIELNNEMLWTPIDYFTFGSLDGQSHRIYGNIYLKNDFYTGIFRYVANAVIKNFVLDLNVTFSSPNNHEEYFGILAGGCRNTQIINCVNHSDVIAPFWQIGGLVGRMGDNTSVLACGNTGYLTSSYECRAMGGIVAHMEDYKPTVDGCYNTGNMKTAGVYWDDGLHIGGIVGWNTGYDQTVVKNCWSNATMTINNPNATTVFMGGIVGEMETGSVTNCYWNQKQEVAVGYQGESVKVANVASFADGIPTFEQIQSLNDALKFNGWQFDAKDGTLKPYNGIITPSIPKEEW